MQVAAKYQAALDALSDFDSTDNTDGTISLNNASVGTSTDAANVDMGVGFSINTTQQGVGAPNVVVVDGESLTRSIKRLDQAIDGVQSSIDTTPYEEIIDVVSGAAANDNEIMGPVVALTNVTIPKNSRNSDIQEEYVVGDAGIELFLNGMRLSLGKDYNEVGAAGSPSTQVQLVFQLEVGDLLAFNSK